MELRADMELRMVPLDLVDRDPEQPRTHFDLQALDSLAKSVREIGIIQPVIVRSVDGRYRLVVGERRWRAAKQAGKREVPAIVLNGESLGSAGSDRIAQLAENLQREDLDPLERAEGIQALMESEGLSQRAAAQRLGVPRTTLMDWLDILKVSPRFQEAVVLNARGGSACLTLAHVNEAIALESRRPEAGLAERVLELSESHALSKAQMRHLCARLKEQLDLEPEQALRQVLATSRPKGASTTTPETPETPDEHVRQLLLSLERSGQYVERMAHLSSRFVDPDLRVLLIERFEQLRRLTERAIEQLSAPPEETTRRIKEESRRRRRDERKRSKQSLRRQLASLHDGARR